MQVLKAEEHTYLTGSVLRTLAQNRITTVLEFLQEDAGKLSILTKLTLPQVLAVRNDILNKYAAPLIKVGSLKTDTLQERKSLNTGILSLDAATGGGLPIGFITEVCGLADSGKTQLCLHLAIACAKSSENNVLYIDTKGDFSAVRVQKILDACGYSHKEMAMIMFKIKIVHIWTMEELVELFKKLKNGVMSVENLGLIIIDSLPCLMFQFLGDGNKVGLSFLNTFVNYARFLCKEQNICMVCVNIQTRWMDHDNIEIEDDGEQTSYGKQMFPTERRNRCLGKYWQHIPMMVLFMEKEQDSRSSEMCSETNITITVLDNSQTLNSNVCTIMLNNLGIT
ncbi:hypothetical protein MSG28_003598 [Choristoneura fumiferana]|uniref:Uncharacterized protein n=1 Tax=Choristoneura fumiferana TaxID=7141 RepID=A0ACC0KGR5_CHOFU|nr:hypothetical protein MSG28_003598 [Choristoneura fumiferana]